MPSLVPPHIDVAPTGPTSHLDVQPDMRRALLDIARLALAVATGGADATELARALEPTTDLDEPAAVFVTLTREGVLRGCVGTFRPARPLRRAVAAAAISAAVDDPRFRPLTADELPSLHIEISVLGPPRRLADPRAFRPGIDGVIVERNGRVALLLPEVASNHSWRAAEMLGAVCQKAGLRADAWHNPGTRLSAFRTVRFGGPAIA